MILSAFAHDQAEEANCDGEAAIAEACHYEETGHFPQLERPDRFADDIEVLLRER